MFEDVSIQDLAFAKALGIPEKEVRELSLHQMRIKMQRKAFQMRDNNETITQEEANILNNRLNEILFE